MPPGGGAAAWRYRTTAPTADSVAPGHHDAEWRSGPGGFGVRPGPGVLGGPPAALVRTEWNTPEIWPRLRFDAPGLRPEALRLRLTHSGPCEVYLNGKLALRRTGAERGYDDHPPYEEARRALRPGANVLAVQAAAP